MTSPLRQHERAQLDQRSPLHSALHALRQCSVVSLLSVGSLLCMEELLIKRAYAHHPSTTIGLIANGPQRRVSLTQRRERSEEARATRLSSSLNVEWTLSTESSLWGEVSARSLRLEGVSVDELSEPTLSSEVWGVGDAELGVTRRVLSGGQGQLSLSLGTTLPTGDEQLGLGEGALRVTPSAQAQARLGAGLIALATAAFSQPLFYRPTSLKTPVMGVRQSAHSFGLSAPSATTSRVLSASEALELRERSKPSAHLDAQLGLAYPWAWGYVSSAWSLSDSPQERAAHLLNVELGYRPLPQLRLALSVDLPIAGEGLPSERASLEVGWWF